MKANAVSKLLREVGLPDVMNPYGFPIGEGFRLECAGGIAGRTDHWRIVHIPSGRVMDGWHRYKKTLKPSLLNWKTKRHGGKSGKIICDGCNVGMPFEHRCHGGNAYVCGERTGLPCECKDCEEKSGQAEAQARKIVNTKKG